MNYVFDDKLSHRRREHINLLVLKGQGIVEFCGESIPPVLRVIRKGSVRNGKWSHNWWEVEIDDSQAIPIVFSQEWETGEYFTSCTWSDAISLLGEIVQSDENSITDAMLETFIRARFPKDADRFDEEEANNSDNKIAELLAAQAELAAAQKEAAEMVKKIRQMEETERLRAEAEATRQRMTKAREMMAKGISLAELKSILGA